MDVEPADDVLLVRRALEAVVAAGVPLLHADLQLTEKETAHSMFAGN